MVSDRLKFEIEDTIIVRISVPVSVLLIAVYNPHLSQNFKNIIVPIIRQFKETNSSYPILIMGDLNLKPSSVKKLTCSFNV